MTAANELLGKLRKGREFKIALNGHTFVARRPTDAEYFGLTQTAATGGHPFFDVAANFVVNWEGMTENDVAGGGGSDIVPFDAALWRAWCADRADLWESLAMPIIKAYETHKQSLEDSAKNSPPGSS